MPNGYTYEHYESPHGERSYNENTSSKKKMTKKERLRRIAQIIENVDNRCSETDGPGTTTLKEMTHEEICEIYNLAVGK